MSDCQLAKSCRWQFHVRCASSYFHPSPRPQNKTMQPTKVQLNQLEGLYHATIEIVQRCMPFFVPTELELLDEEVNITWAKSCNMLELNAACEQLMHLDSSLFTIVLKGHSWQVLGDLLRRGIIHPDQLKNKLEKLTVLAGEHEQKQLDTSKTICLTTLAQYWKEFHQQFTLPKQIQLSGDGSGHWTIADPPVEVCKALFTNPWAVADNVWSLIGPMICSSWKTKEEDHCFVYDVVRHKNKFALVTKKIVIVVHVSRIQIGKWNWENCLITDAWTLDGSITSIRPGKWLRAPTNFEKAKSINVTLLPMWERLLFTC